MPPGCLSAIAAAAAVLACSALAPAATASSGDLPLVPDKGGFPLADMMLGRMPRPKHDGKPAFFFAMKPDIDIWVSTAMLTFPNGWEWHLSALFDSLAAAHPESADDPVVDIGANFGAFSLHVAGTGRRLWSFEMQPLVYTCLELSRRVNDYSNMKLIHTALWNVSGAKVHFTPVASNLGGTGVVNKTEGTNSMITTTVTEHFAHKRVFFMKIDTEGAEDHIVAGMQHLFSRHGVQHFVWETRPDKGPLTAWFYDIGYACTTFISGRPDTALKTREEAIQTVKGTDMGDLYCTLPDPEKAKPLENPPVVPVRRTLAGRFDGQVWG